MILYITGVKYKPSSGGDNEGPPSVEEQLHALQHKIKHFKANGLIFWREDLDDNTPLKLRFASLTNGLVDIYRNEEEYEKNYHVFVVFFCYITLLCLLINLFL